MKKLHETTEAPAESGPVADGPRLTSRQLAQLHGLDRDRMEAELDRLGLRSPQDDGSSTYPAGEVARRFEMEDLAKVTAAAALADRFSSDSLVRQAVQEAFIELREKWLIGSGLFEEVASLKRGIAAKLAKTHAVQRAQRAGDIWQELAAIERFEQGLQAAIRERRQPAKTKTEEGSDV